MARYLEDWLKSYMAYTAHNESPDIFHFWAGVSAVAGALRRKVYIDQVYWRWYPNFYIVLVAPSGIAAKSAAITNARKILKEVPGIHFGPSVMTWQSLLPAFEEAQEDSAEGLMSCLTFITTELGTLLDPEDRKMVDVLTNLWDGFDDEFDKMTKGTGHEIAYRPWINWLSGTTPIWWSENMGRTATEGGLGSRVIPVYADSKRQLIAYIKRRVPPDLEKLREALVHDLEDISLLSGEYTLTEEAYKYGEQWYEKLYEEQRTRLAGTFDGYISRKQGHVHKVAMVLSAAKRGDLVIDMEDLKTAIALLDSIEPDMLKVVAFSGKDPQSERVGDLIKLMKGHRQLTKQALYRLLFTRTGMSGDDYERAVQSALSAGVLRQEIIGSRNLLIYMGTSQPAEEPPDTLHSSLDKSES